MTSAVRNYEMVYILRPDLDEAKRRDKQAKIQEIIATEGGQVQGTEDWGSRILAYEIQRFREGYYALVTFSLPTEKVRAVEQRLRMDDTILRYQIVRLDGG